MFREMIARKFSFPLMENCGEKKKKENKRNDGGLKKTLNLLSDVDV